MFKLRPRDPSQNDRMLGRFRNRVIIINAALIGLVLLVLFSTIWTLDYRQNMSRMDQHLKESIHAAAQSGNSVNGSPNGEGDGPSAKLPEDRQGDIDAPLEPTRGRQKRGDLDITPTVVARLSRDGKIIDTVNNGTDLTADDIDAIVQYASELPPGRLHRIKSLNVFVVTQVQDGDLYLAAAGTYRVMEHLQDNTLNMIIAWIVFMVLYFLFNIVMTNHTLRPVRRAWQQQQQFVADASHELKTPLTVILANSAILAEDETLSGDARQWVDSTQEEAQHMQSLINDMLYLARNDSGSQKMIRQELSLSELAEENILQFEPVAYEQGIDLTSSITPDLKILGDATMIRQLYHILLDNACKYSPAGSTVNLSLTKERTGPVLRIHNMGDPISAEDLPHIFDRFYRSDKARTYVDESGGYGLGLAIARTIAEEHGGAIGVSSSAAAGTTFTVTFREHL